MAPCCALKQRKYGFLGASPWWGRHAWRNFCPSWVYWWFWRSTHSSGLLESHLSRNRSVHRQLPEPSTYLFYIINFSTNYISVICHQNSHENSIKKSMGLFIIIIEAISFGWSNAIKITLIKTCNEKQFKNSYDPHFHRRYRGGGINMLSIHS